MADNTCDVTLRDITWSELSRMLISGDSYLSEGKFRLIDEACFEANTAYIGSGASVVFPKGIEFGAAQNVVVQDLGILGNVTICDECRNISFNNCNFSAKDTAIISHAQDLTLYKCSVKADTCIVSYQTDLDVEECSISANKCAISVFGSNSIIKSNLISVGEGGIGVDISKGTENTLVALNTISGADRSIRVKSSLNCVLILNKVKCIDARSSVSLYVNENTIDGSVRLLDNSYLLCDSNQFTCTEGFIIADKNSFTNGDNITDISQRTVGACEEILPHTNKDLFIDMTRKTRVREASVAIASSLHKYIDREAKDNEIVIVPPGAYTENETLELKDAHSNTTIYAYGVYDEFTKYDVILSLGYASDVSVHGLTLGYVGQSSGQIHFLKKLGNNKMLAVSAAGYIYGYGSSDPELFSTSTSDLFVGGKLYPKMTKHGTISVERNGDGTLTVTFSDEAYYNKTNPGDIHACRMAGGNRRTILVRDSKNILFKDIVLYGYSAAIAFGAFGRLENVRLERFHNTVHSPYVIDASEYKRYKKLEELFGVDLEVHVDKCGRFRGAIPRVGSVDATHISTATHGVSLTSCLLESMCDDGSNQHASSARLHKIEDDGNGITTLYIKSCLSEVYYNKGITSGGCCGYVSRGDRLLIHTSEGRLFCDTAALSDQVSLEPIKYTLPYKGADAEYSSKLFCVKVSTDAIDISALTRSDGSHYDLSDNGYTLENKVFVDNLSLNSAGFNFDNVLVRNTRSRGMLIKTVGATVKHSTFQNLGFTGLLLNSEPKWGESTIAQDVTVYNCIFDNLGFMDGGYWHKIYASIAIGAPICSLSEKSIICKNFIIDGCRFTNSKNVYAITVRGAQNIKIKNNVFDLVCPHNEPEAGVAIDIDGALNVEISGNAYPSIANSDISAMICAKNYKGLYGSDVDGIFSESNLLEKN